MTRITAANERIAVRATLVFGSMWVTYALFLYGFAPVLWPAAMNTLLYWSNTVQLWSLPLLMVGQNVLGRAGERRSAETHDAVMAELATQREQGNQLAELVEALHTKHADVATELRVATEERDVLLRGMETIHQETAAVHEIVSTPAAPGTPPSGATVSGGGRVGG